MDWARIAASRPGSVLLQTARAEPENQSSYLFTDPVEVLSAHRLDEIPGLFAAIEDALTRGCYVAGFLSYETGYHFEPKALEGSELASDQVFDPALPLAWFGIYDAPQMCGATDGLTFAGEGAAARPAELALALSEEEYSLRIEAIRRAIEAGDLYQANFTVDGHFYWNDGPASLFAGMMRSQPTPYGALLHLDSGEGSTFVLSASPELFFRKRGEEITVCPMKGTARRGRDLEEDTRQAEWLAADPKNRAENVMIVDLMRSDLGRICKPGSIAVTDLFAVHRYPSLLQMTSTVRGELAPDTSLYGIFRSLFPCGSITGAPKVRTMQLIRELEESPRGIACGAIGFFSPGEGGNHDAVFSVAIRTVTLRGEEARMRIGSGITYGSEAKAEYEECLLKTRFLSQLSARRQDDFSLIETLAWAGDYALLELHLDRLRDSAAHFDFHYDEEHARAELGRHAEGFHAGSRRRVRLSLGRDGDISISSAPLEPVCGTAVLQIASTRVDSDDPFLRHKTTRRVVYDEALAGARAAGCDDAIFLNAEGQVTECTIYNLMIDRDGEWVTPPIENGLLPGVYRRYLLAAHPEVRVAPISLDELLAAGRILVFNSVRGLRRARLHRSQ